MGQAEGLPIAQPRPQLELCIDNSIAKPPKDFRAAIKAAISEACDKGPGFPPEISEIIKKAQASNALDLQEYTEWLHQLSIDLHYENPGLIHAG